MDFESYYTCRNRHGRYSNGRKITNIEFVNKKNALISTSDSRIRLMNMEDGKILVKYKGHTNTKIKSSIKAHYELVCYLIFNYLIF